MSNNKTIVYYTCNRENENFENKVKDRILKVGGGLPIVSVSQKPIDFGTNICVGNLQQNYKNAFSQALMGCLAAKTDYVVMCEDDVLYPEHGYFDFKPKEKDVIYTYDNVWLMWDRENRTRFYKHGTTGGSIIIGRDFYVDFLKSGHNFFDKNLKWEKFSGEPMVNIKTRQGVSFGTKIENKAVGSLLNFGTVEDVKKNYLR